MRHVKQDNSVFLQKFAAMAVGNIMEWFDFSSFGALADIIGYNFFPGDGPSLQLLKALGVFGAAFLMRPLGGIIIGQIGDTLGRKKALEISIALMLLPSFLIGCLPSYHQIGWLAPVALVFFRLLQGLAAGGELVGAFLYTIEATNGVHIGFWGGACKATGNLGTTLGVGVVTVLRSVLTSEQLRSWGWRIPFWMGLLFGVVGVYMRRNLGRSGAGEESAEFLQARKVRQLQQARQSLTTLTPSHCAVPLVAVCQEHWRAIVVIVCVAAFWCTSFYTTCVWLVYFMQDTDLIGDHPIRNAWVLSFVANCCLVGLLPLGGWLGDSLGSALQNVQQGIFLALQIAQVLMISVVLPAFFLILTKSFYLVILGQWLLILPIALFGGNLPAYMISQFPPPVRYTGVGLGYNVANALFASTTSLVQTSLVLSHSTAADNDIISDPRLRPAYYICAIAVISFVALSAGVSASMASERKGDNEKSGDYVCIEEKEDDTEEPPAK